jgi:peptide/nickel transport system substrate-binding protein
MFGGGGFHHPDGGLELTEKLKQPSATWQYILGTTAGHIVSKAYYEAHKDTFGTSEGGILGTGAFAYESWKSGQEIVLTKNSNYWDKGVEVSLSKIIYKIIPEDTPRGTALQTGQVDFTVETPLDMVDTLKADSKLAVEGVDTLGLTFLAFNTQRAPFNDVNVRKAIYHALDMKAIHDNIVKSAGLQGTVLPNGPALYTIEPERWQDYLSKAPVYEYNLEKAKEYMAKSSVPNGFNCKLLTTESSLRYSESLAIQEALKAININVELVKLSSDEHTSYQFGGVLDANGKRDYDMILAGWEADYPDISGNIEPLYASAGAGADGTNAAAYVNKKVDELIDAQAVGTKPGERNDLVFQALDIITDEVPYIFFEYPIKQTVLNKKFTGFTMNASWLWNLYFKKYSSDSLISKR